MFALPQIGIVAPQLVVCLGPPTFNAIRIAWGHTPFGKLSAAIEAQFQHEGIWIWAQAHTGARGRNSRGADQVNADWARMAAAIH
jgi:hypothetical protein